MLIINQNKFKLDIRTHQTIFFIEKKENINFSVGMAYEDGYFDKEEVSPSLNINTITTSAKTLEELVGYEFEVMSVEESDKRQDRFYLFNHEPFMNFKLKILDIKNNFVTISCTGEAVIESYEDSYLVGQFELKEKLPMIQENTDWELFDAKSK